MEKVVKVVKRKLVKPCIPTPHHLKTYKFSFFDDLIQPSHSKFGLLFLYANSAAASGEETAGITVMKMEESLSKTLAQFYPLAGRFRMEDHCVDCSDQGAEFVVAHAPHADVATLTACKNLQTLDCFVTAGRDDDDDDRDEDADEPILSIQITHLNCGGVVVGALVSHKIFDGASLATFMAAWSNTHHHMISNILITPVLDPSSLFPSINNDDHHHHDYSSDIDNKGLSRSMQIVAKRFAFTEEAIGSMRSRLRAREGKRGVYSRVRVVSAFISRAILRSNQDFHSKGLVIGQAISIRERTVPPLSRHYCGNLVVPVFVGIGKEMGMQQVVDVMSEAVDERVGQCSEMLRMDEQGLKKMMMMSPSTASASRIVWFTDGTKFGFYGVDFGGGKPVWVSFTPVTWENVGVVLLENKDGNGIEALVSLDINHMALFEEDGDIRMLATTHMIEPINMMISKI